MAQHSISTLAPRARPVPANRRLAEAADSSVLLLDLEAVAGEVGRRDWCTVYSFMAGHLGHEEAGTGNGGQAYGDESHRLSKGFRSRHGQGNDAHAPPPDPRTYFSNHLFCSLSRNSRCRGSLIPWPSLGKRRNSTVFPIFFSVR